MKSKPPTPTAATTSQQDTGHNTFTRSLARIRRRRRAAALQLLRGLFYGIGTGTAGLAFWWLQQHL
jgi:hypothetical protein